MKWPTVLPCWQYNPSNVEYPSERMIPANESMFPVKRRDKHYRRWRKYAAIIEAKRAAER